MPAPRNAEDHPGRGALVTRLRAEGGHGEMLRIRLTDSKQETAIIDAIRRERTDEYHEVVERTRQFHEELQLERRRGRTTYTELEESDADLARYQNGSPPSVRVTTSMRPAARSRRRRRVVRGGTRPVRKPRPAAELDEPTPASRPELRALEGGNEYRSRPQCAAFHQMSWSTNT